MRVFALKRYCHLRILFALLVTLFILNVLLKKIANSFPTSKFLKMSGFIRKEYLENIPLLYLSTNKFNRGYNKTCARYPDLKQLHFSNNYWQVLEFKYNNTIFHILGAYLDTRKLNKNGESVRLIAAVNKGDVPIKTYCQLWYESNKKPIISQVVKYKLIWEKKWGVYKEFLPYLVTCNVPKEYFGLVPQSVSLVDQPCGNATNNLRVIYNKPETKKNFAVCVKGLDFPDVDLSYKLIEWIDLLLILGADKIYFYELEVHPNIKAVLDYYEELGKIQLTPFTLPAYEANNPLLRHRLLSNFQGVKRLDEVIPYNDCFYKHMYEYKYIALLDTDEVIIPLKYDNWTDLMAEIEKEIQNTTKKDKVKKTYSSFNFRNVYFMDEFQHIHEWYEGIPKDMHMLQHVIRSKNYTKPGNFIKCFHNTESVLTLHNHFPFSCLNGGCNSFSVNTSIGHLQHYRTDCVGELKNVCAQYKNNTVVDNNIWRFKDELIENFENVLKELYLYREFD